MRRVFIGIITGAAVFAACAVPASAQQLPKQPVNVPEPVKEAFITAGNAVDEAEREVIDFTCYVLLGVEPGTCVS